MTPVEADYLADELQDKAVVIRPGQGETLELAGGRMTLKITSALSNDQLGLYEITLAPGVIGARPHFHRFMDETFLVNNGRLTVQLSGKDLDAEAGSVIYVPRFTPHGFCNNSEHEVTLTLIFNPAQKREGFFLGLKDILSEQPVDPDKFLRLYNKYDSFPVDVKNMLPLAQ